MRTLMWFRSDLRTRDNLALAHACAHSTRGVVGVFLLAPAQWREHDESPAKIDFILRTLRELSGSLARLNVPLLLAPAPRFADAADALRRVARAYGCDALAFNREYEINESRRDVAVERAMAAAGVQTRAFDDQVFAAPGNVRTGEGNYYTVFSPFKRALYARMVRDGLPAPVGEPRAQAAMACASDPVPEAVEGYERPGNAGALERLWPAGERTARARLERFAERAIGPYKARRDFPGEPGTSRLSAYLNIGAVSCRECLAAAVAANPVSGARSPLDSGLEGVVHWISELVWREFYVHIMVGFPRVCMGRAFQPATERLRWSDNDAHFEAWCAGRTGVPIVDAGMRQLHAEGWMHNRARMITAMYLTKNLFIDWRRGERFFAQNLIDNFLASNNGGWQWSASTGTDAAPYFRIFNPVSQSKKFDPDGAYIRQFVPELRDVEGEAVHEPWELPGLLRPRLDYPEPLVDLSKSREAAIKAFQAIKA